MGFNVLKVLGKIVFLGALVGCSGSVVQQGVYSGRVVDVSWGGYVFKSCCIVLQYGDQSSERVIATTASKDFCKKIRSYVGAEVEMQYKVWAVPYGITLDSRNEVITVDLSALKIMERLTK